MIDRTTHSSTIIVGLRDEKEGLLYVGGDTLGTYRNQAYTRKDNKVFWNGPYLMGCCGSYRMIQILRHNFLPPDPPKIKEGEDPWMTLHAFLCVDFIDTLRECLSDCGASRQQDGMDQGANFVLAVFGELFEVQSDHQVAGYPEPYLAVGCAEDLARGALYATEDLGLLGRERLERALRAACRGSSGCAPPFTIEAMTLNQGLRHQELRLAA